MADLPSAIVKMNDIEIAGDAPTTEAVMKKFGSNINALIDRKVTVDEITASGTWDVPNVNPDWVWLLGCGGGGGGGGGGNTGARGNGGGGGSGSQPMLIAVDISAEAALASLTVTIGAGGGGAGGFGTGANGGDTTLVGLSTYATFKGGIGGSHSNNTISPSVHYGVTQLGINSAVVGDPGYTIGFGKGNYMGEVINGQILPSGGGSGETLAGAVQNGYAGENSIYASGGAGGALSGAFCGGGGGGAGLGAGGVGGSGVFNAVGGTGGIGAGGGGNGGDSGGVFAGAGGPGYLAVIYFDVSV